MSKIKLFFLLNLVIISSFSFAQETSFWPNQLGLTVKQMKKNIGEEFNITKISEDSNTININKAFILNREAQILAQGYNGHVYIITLSFSSFKQDLFKDLNIHFTKKYGKPIHPFKNEMYNDEVADGKKVTFWDLKKYTIMLSLSNFGLSIQYLDTELYKERQKEFSKQLDQEKNKL
ncbi:hypothetical protein [Pedobacter alpinus]|uniref:DUF4468 domain-containing protein n=1 Tax=Pedobacter alpinus TaxID=1590643 RepID=A0ABW5TQX1_9SPHI